MAESASGFAASKAVRADAALQVAPELLLHVPRQALAGTDPGVLEKALQVLLDDVIEHGHLWAALLVLLRRGAGHGALASAKRVPRGVQRKTREPVPLQGLPER